MPNDEHREPVDRDAAEPGGVAIGGGGPQLTAELRVLEQEDHHHDDDRGDAP